MSEQEPALGSWPRETPPDGAAGYHRDGAGREWAQDADGRWWMQPLPGAGWYPSFPETMEPPAG